MFGIGFSEMILLAVIALVVIGPKQLPEVARAIAKFLNELKRASSEATGALMSLKDESTGYIKNVTQVTEEKKPDTPETPPKPS